MRACFCSSNKATPPRLLCRARSAAPAIVFFDEIDGLAVNRAQEGASGGASLEARVLATLLSEMDGLQVRAWPETAGRAHGACMTCACARCRQCPVLSALPRCSQT